MKVYFPVFILAIVGCAGSNEVQNPPGLKSGIPFPVGSAVGNKQFMNDSLYQQVFFEDFNSVTAENIMKMRAIAQSPDSLHFSEVDQFVAKCSNANIRIHGHCLIWHQATPQYVKDYTHPDTLDAFMQQYIHRVVSRYKGKIASWDVVNEAVSDSVGIMRTSVWYDLLGYKFIENAFVYAHRADPEAKLFYNDYGIEYDTNKLNTMLAFIDDMLARKIPIHGVGFQLHTVVDSPPLEVISAAIDSVVKRGLLVHISELDIRLNEYHRPERYAQLDEQLDSLHALRYRAIAQMYYNVPAEQRWGITLWNFADKYSWIRSYYKANDWPAIYDDSLKKKKSWYGFKKGLSEIK